MCYENQRSATIMSLGFLTISSHQSVLVQKSDMLKLLRRSCAKQLYWQSCRLGSSYLLMNYHDFRQNAFFFKEWSLSSLIGGLIAASQS